LYRLEIRPQTIWARLSAGHYGAIRAALEKQGTPIGANDLMIAAHARALHAVCVTGNVAEFSRVSGLKVENWLE